MADRSSVATDSSTYTAGSDMALTVMLKDTNANPVPGLAAGLKDGDTVTVPGAILKTAWTESGAGIYTATYTATNTAGTGLKATLKLSGWSSAASSKAYAIEPVTLKSVITESDGFTFAKDAGFPTTGYKGAQFTLALSSGSASDFDWTSDAPSWVSVSAGVVSFTGNGTKDRVTITGTPKSGGTAITYSFTLSSWFIGRYEYLNWPNAAAFCTAQSGYSLPTVQQITGGGSAGTRGALGALWSEWGTVVRDIASESIWSSEQKSSNEHYYLLLILSSGVEITSGNDGYRFSVICRKGL